MALNLPLAANLLRGYRVRRDQLPLCLKIRGDVGYKREQRLWISTLHNIGLDTRLKDFERLWGVDIRPCCGVRGHAPQEEKFCTF